MSRFERLLFLNTTFGLVCQTTTEPGVIYSQSMTCLLGDADRKALTCLWTSLLVAIVYGHGLSREEEIATSGTSLLSLSL